MTDGYPIMNGNKQEEYNLTDKEVEKMTLEEMVGILEKNIHTDPPKSAIAARKRDEAILMALKALEKQIPKEFIERFAGNEYVCERPICHGLMSNNAIKPDTYVSLAQQYIKSEINEAQFEERCSRLEMVPKNIGIRCEYMSISEKFMQGEISEDEFVERYNRLVEQDAEKHWEPVEPHEHI